MSIADALAVLADSVPTVSVGLGLIGVITLSASLYVARLLYVRFRG